MPSAYPHPAESQAGRRRHSRLRVCLPARLITLDGILPVTLLDLSFSGAKIALGSRTLRVGAEAVLTWGDSFEAFCSVAWLHDGGCGLDFDEPLRSNVLIATRDMADATPRTDARRVAAEDWVAGRVSR